MNASSEVFVIGGGPAGAVIATQLARLGHDVLLADRGDVRPPRVESLSPAAGPLLASIGVRIDAPAVSVGQPIRTSLVRWSHATPRMVVFPIGSMPILVDRARFDDMLRAAAIRAGARVIRPAVVSRARRFAAGWELIIAEGNRQRAVAARFLVDASGRTSQFARPRSLRSARIVALHGIWPEARALDRCMIVDRHGSNWCWGSSVGDRRGVQAIAFLSTDGFSLACRTVDRVSLYRRLVASMPLAGKWTSRSRLGSMQVRDATVSEAATVVEADFIRIGDASFTVDPLSSAGVQSAIQSAITGGVVVHTMLERTHSANVAMRFYRDARRRSMRHYHDLAAAFHAALPPLPFPDDRSGDDGSQRKRRPATRITLAPHDNVALSSTTTFGETPCITGDYVELRCGVHHHRLDRPVVYVGGVELAPMLSRLRMPTSYRTVIDRWAGAVGTERAHELLEWVVRHGLLVPAGPANRESVDHADDIAVASLRSARATSIRAASGLDLSIKAAIS